MNRPFLRSDAEITRIYETYGGTVYRVCFFFLRRREDAEDAVQETFFRLIRTGPVFESETHLKAWLIRVANIALGQVSMIVSFAFTCSKTLEEN